MNRFLTIANNCIFSLDYGTRHINRKCKHFQQSTSYHKVERLLINVASASNHNAAIIERVEESTLSARLTAS
jgi:transposase-like protein